MPSLLLHGDLQWGRKLPYLDLGKGGLVREHPRHGGIRWQLPQTGIVFRL